MPGFVLDGYDPQGFYCEMLRCAATAELRRRLGRLPIDDFRRRNAAAEQALYDYGITFTLYSQNSAIDRILPFDPIPRVDGIEASADPLFELRANIYLMSGRRRRAAGA